MIPVMMTFRNFSGFGLLLLLAGCSSDRGLELTPVGYHELPGWQKDNHHDAHAPLKKSCQALLKKGDARWHKFCKAIHTSSPHQTRKIIESHLQPHRVSSDGTSLGKFTGYYEPLLKGSRRRYGPYQTPLYRLPPGSIDYRVPREEIISGALANKNLELVWVTDPVAAFFLEIQGSGRIQLDTGEIMRIGYAGQNGQPYVAIGLTLVEQGHLRKEEVSMQSIRQWLKNNPNKAKDVMCSNPSYVFFKELKGDGPVGAQGVALTPGRSLAVDRQHIQLGTPLWIQTHATQKVRRQFQRLVVAQDTGGAIKGHIRGDIFCGHGPDAEQLAGYLNAPGEYYLFLPK